MDEHISEVLFERFLRTEVSREEGQRVVSHLIAGCPQCSALALRLTSELGLWPAKGSARPGWEQAYEEVFSRAMAFARDKEQRLALEKLRGWGQWAELESATPQLRFVMVENDRSYHTFGLYDRLLEASRWYIRSEPAEAVDILRWQSSWRSASTRKRSGPSALPICGRTPGRRSGTPGGSHPTSRERGGRSTKHGGSSKKGREIRRKKATS